VIIPPTWYKYNYLDVITRIWSRAIQEISLSTHLFIIGYSFPRTDVFFEQLLTLGLTSSANLKKVIIINPDAQVKELINAVFDTHFLGRSVSFHQLRFEDLSSVMQPLVEEKDMDDLLKRIEDLEKHPEKYSTPLGVMLRNAGIEAMNKRW
jgi:hypothetical protein